MAQSQFVQIPCGKCGTTVWISPAAGVGYCPQCHTPNQLPQGAAAPAPGGFAPPQQGGAGGYGAPGGASPYGAPPPVATPAPAGFTGMPMSTPGLPVLKIAGALGLAVVVGGLGLGGNYAKNRFMGGGGKASTSSMGIDNTKKADPDKMILGAGTLARKWRSDAVFRSINIQKLESDGTVDLTKGNVSLEYFSPSGVTSFVKKQSDDSIKKFSFNDDRVTFKDIWGVKKRMETAPNATAMPACTTRMLAAKLAEKGLKPGKTAHVLLDPDLSMRGSLTWHVMSEDPKLDLHFDPMTCAPKS